MRSSTTWPRIKFFLWHIQNVCVWHRGMKMDMKKWNEKVNVTVTRSVVLHRYGSTTSHLQSINANERSGRRSPVSQRALEGLTQQVSHGLLMRIFHCWLRRCCFWHHGWWWYRTEKCYVIQYCSAILNFKSSSNCKSLGVVESPWNSGRKRSRNCQTWNCQTHN